MNLKTLDKNHAVHVLNMVSVVLAWGVTCYFFDAVVTNNTVELIVEILMSPVYFADIILGLFTDFSISGHFNLMFLILWFCYSGPISALYPLLMVKNHDPLELKEWYVTKCDNHINSSLN